LLGSIEFHNDGQRHSMRARVDTARNLNQEPRSGAGEAPVVRGMLEGRKPVDEGGG
jgi:hypothetical protein